MQVRLRQVDSPPRILIARLQLQQHLICLNRRLILLILQVQPGHSLQRLRASRIHLQRLLVEVRSILELVLVKRRRRLAHREPEARSPQRILHRGRPVSHLLGLRQVTHRAAKIILLHAQEAHARRRPAILLVRIQQRLESCLRLIQPVRIQRRKRRLFLRRPRNPGVHLRQLRFIFLQLALDLRVPRMLLHVFLQLRRRLRIRRIPQQCLPQRRSRFRILLVLPQNLDALGSCARVIAQHPPQRHRIPRIAGVPARHRPHPHNRFLLPVRSGIQRVVVRHAHVAIWRRLTKILPVQLHRCLGISRPRQRAGLSQPLISRLVAGHRLNLADIRVIRIRPPQLVQSLIRGLPVPRQPIAPRHAFHRQLVVRV